MITVAAASTNLSFFCCSKSSFLPLSATHNFSSKRSNTVFSHSQSGSWQLNWKRTTQNTLDLERSHSCGDSGGVAHVPPAKGPSAISMPHHFSFFCCIHRDFVKSLGEKTRSHSAFPVLGKQHNRSKALPNLSAEQEGESGLAIK